METTAWEKSIAIAMQADMRNFIIGYFVLEIPPRDHFYKSIIIMM
jgi:hypothetical protein